MIPDQVKSAISKALFLLPPPMTSPEARVMLYAIGLQESRFQHRRQLIKKHGEMQPIGPAKGFWQFERLGGCAGVVRHDASRYWMHHLCKDRKVDFNATAIWNAIETDDVLAAGAARLLLFTDPKKLPALGDENVAWNLYARRTWLPGKPHRDTWAGFYAEAMEAL